MATNIDNTAGKTMIGTGKDDVIKGDVGNDVLLGKAGSDELWGGLGDDTIDGGAGDDRLFGDGSAVIGKTTLITMQENHPVKVAFNYEEAGYRNSFGVYKVDAATGKITDVEIIWKNASLAGSGGDLVANFSHATVPAKAGDQIGFFIVADGFSLNNWAKLNGGHFEFRNADGTTASLGSKAPQLWHVAGNGTATQVKQNIYHTAAYDKTQGMNADGQLHTVGLLQSDQGTMKIGFEDLFGGGDKDYDDTVFTIDVGPSTAKVLNAHFTQTSDTIATTDVAHWSKLNPTTVNDKIMGRGGADQIDGMEGNDLLAGGGVGKEWVLQNGQWVYKGLAVNKGLSPAIADASDDTLTGGTGNDVLLGGKGHDLMSGGDGNDTLNGGEGNDVMAGGAGKDLLNGDAGDDVMLGDAGDDILNGGDGQDALSGGEGADSLRAGTGDDKLGGDEGNDELFGGTGNDVALGGAGDDKLFGNEGADRLEGGAGVDYLEGGADADQLFGDAGNDRLMGGAGADRLDGGSEVDTLVGGLDGDRLSGGAGDDQLWGGEWKADGAGDTFVFAPGCGKDQINDFEIGRDTLDLSGFNTSWSTVQTAIEDKGWATYIDLGKLEHGQAGDLVILKDVHAKDLDPHNVSI
jgi:serralysin